MKKSNIHNLRVGYRFYEEEWKRYIKTEQLATAVIANLVVKRHIIISDSAFNKSQVYPLSYHKYRQ